MTTLLSHLKSRGCIHDASHFEDLEQTLEQSSVTFYCGFDPTADSLHAGSMLPLILMRRLQERGHRPIALLGSGTGMIGDPSGKSEERTLLSQDVLARNTKCLEAQVGIFLKRDGPNGFLLARNDEWLSKLGLIEFLRDVGKHFTVNSMTAKDSVRSRLENREQGISFTEFSYMLLQAYDFYYLHKEHGCRLQVGGSDQWGNITAGLELIRRKGKLEAPQAYGLTFPLLTTSTGAKFGKTEEGAVWLDKNKTSPYRFYQYWLNTSDADVLQYLRLFTEVDGEELSQFARAVQEKPEQRLAQNALAERLTALVHGCTEAERAQAASSVLFGGDIKGVDSATLIEIFKEVPSATVERSAAQNGIPLQDLLVQAGAAASKSAARRAIEAGGIYLNNERVGDVSAKVTINRFIDEAVLVLRSGKKKYYLVCLS